MLHNVALLNMTVKEGCASIVGGCFCRIEAVVKETQKYRKYEVNETFGHVNVATSPQILLC
jgi:hypothetical protein